MPICTRSVSAVVRSRAAAPFSASKTLVPFLYQTSTIQQWQPAAHSQTRRTLATSPNRDDEAPITVEEDDALPPSLEEVVAARAASAKSTTMTRSERQAFGKLYNQFNTEARDQKLREDDMDMIADEWYEEDEKETEKEQATEENLDELFEAVLAGLPPPKEAAKSTEAPAQVRKPLTMEKRERSRMNKRQAKNKEFEERQRFNQLLDLAPTDRALWLTLECEVLDKIRALDLDGEHKGNTKKAGAVSKPSVGETKILFHNFPLYLIDTAVRLRKNFATSQLPFTIVPTLKGMGRSAYALGASTPLYNLLIRASWKQYGSFDMVNELLIDMNNAGLEYNDRTISLFQYIQQEYRLATLGRLGKVLAKVYGAEALKEKYDEFLSLAFPGQKHMDEPELPMDAPRQREVEPLIPFGRPAPRHRASADDIPLVM